MKRNLIVCILVSLLVFTGCVKNPCDGVITYYKIDPRLNNYVFKPGSFWVYRNTTDGIIDSQYVHRYSTITHYKFWDPDTVRGPNHDPCKEARYTDILGMYIVSIQNNAFKDSLLIGASSNNEKGIINTLSVYEHKGLINQTGIPSFILDYDKIGLVYDFTNSIHQWYEGKQTQITSGNYVFYNVDIFKIQINDVNATRFTNPTDLYFSDGTGIIKIIEHRLTGDVSWDLVNYNIIH